MKLSFGGAIQTDSKQTLGADRKYLKKVNDAWVCGGWIGRVSLILQKRTSDDDTLDNIVFKTVIAGKHPKMSLSFTDAICRAGNM